MVLAGDIDEATYGGLTAALSSVADVPGDIHVDLGGVQFCDVAGLRALVPLAGASGLTPDLQDRRVVLHTLSAHLKTVLGRRSRAGHRLAGSIPPGSSPSTSPPPGRSTPTSRSTGGRKGGQDRVRCRQKLNITHTP